MYHHCLCKPSVLSLRLSHASLLDKVTLKDCLEWPACSVSWRHGTDDEVKNVLSVVVPGFTLSILTAQASDIVSGVPVTLRTARTFLASTTRGKDTREASPSKDCRHG